jgi:prepilin-type N-terminal cleavage/methylation domain-containing protein
MEMIIEDVETDVKRDKGFTLVELLIVIVILGILATVTVFAVRGITDKGTKSACDADKKTLEVAGEAYFALKGGTTIPATAGTGVVDAEQNTLVVAGLMRTESPKFNLAADGSIAGISPCT